MIKESYKNQKREECTAWPSGRVLDMRSMDHLEALFCVLEQDFFSSA